jgi:hypothetical protein
MRDFAEIIDEFVKLSSALRPAKTAPRQMSLATGQARS